MPLDADHNAMATLTSSPSPSEVLEVSVSRVSWSVSSSVISGGADDSSSCIRVRTSSGSATRPYTEITAANVGTIARKPKNATPAAVMEVWSARNRSFVSSATARHLGTSSLGRSVAALPVVVGVGVEVSVVEVSVMADSVMAGRAP